MCLHVVSEFDSIAAAVREARHDLISDLNLDLAASCALIFACNPKSEYEARIKLFNLTGWPKSLLDECGDRWHDTRNMFALKACLVCMVTLLFVGACASKRTVTQSQVRLDAWGKPERFSLGKDEQGNPVMKSDLRSSFEGKSSNMAASRDFSGKDYTTKSYARKRWAGNTEYSRKNYDGNTDANHYKMEPWFVRKQAQAEGKQASAQGQTYSTTDFGKTIANEQDSERIERVSDAETDVRRRVYKEPDIIDWKDQQGLGVEDTNRLLGRSE